MLRSNPSLSMTTATATATAKIPPNKPRLISSFILFIGMCSCIVQQCDGAGGSNYLTSANSILNNRNTRTNSKSRKGHGKEKKKENSIIQPMKNDLLKVIRGGDDNSMGGDYYDYDNTDHGQIRGGNPNSPQQNYYQQQRHSQYGDDQAPPEYTQVNRGQHQNYQSQNQPPPMGSSYNYPSQDHQQVPASSNSYDEPQMPGGEPSLPLGEDGIDEPPLPNGPYGDSSYPPQQGGGRGDSSSNHSNRQARPPQPMSRQQPQLQQPQYNTQQQQSEPSASSQTDLELESFDKDLIFSGLKRMYRKKILPLELASKYGHFHSPPLSPSDFEAKPMVLLLGQYSVGKTSFIRYLLGRDFPGIRIGPEPTTDRFNCILQGDTDKVIPGAALCSQADRPFRGLSPFGNNFLSKLEAVELDSPILYNITLVDTPGILSGAKQSIGRNYDYDAVMRWFAERADLIIIMFDAHKLDISDELKRVIELMKPHADKVRVVLNKADSISTQQLMRVYGALMWQLGKVMNTPEVCRVYIGSFWGTPLKNTEQAALLNREKLDLFSDIAHLPQNAVMRRINELVKRARSVKVHAYIIHYLRKQLPYTFGKKEKQARLIHRLEQELVMCARRYELPKGDFPDAKPLRQALLEIKDLSEFPKLDKRMVKDMDKVFSVDIPELLERARGDYE